MEPRRESGGVFNFRSSGGNLKKSQILIHKSRHGNPNFIAGQPARNRRHPLKRKRAGPTMHAAE